MMTFSFRHAAWIALAAMVIPLGFAQAADKEGLFTVSSSAVKDNGVLTAKNAGPGECGGENVSLPLKWANQPPSTKSYAIILSDPDGGRGAGVTHWLAYTIPGSMLEVKSGQGAATGKDITVGKNSRGAEAYLGPCAPHADAPHHYIAQVLALDIAPGTIQPGLDREGLFKMINGHSLKVTSLVLRFRRKE